MKIHIVKLFLQYIKHYRFCAAMFGVFFFIIFCIFALYNIPIEAIIYSFGLCILICAVIFPIHFYKYYEKHKELLLIKHNLPILPEEFSKPQCVFESDYHEIVLTLRELNTALDNNFQSWKSESIDYYSTWVHQIKTPISVMRLMLQQKDTEDNQRLTAELFRIEQYVEMVLTYFRLDSDSSDLVIKQCELDGIIRGVIRKYASQFVIKRLKLNYGGTYIGVVTDEKWLSFIIEQILSNSVKYTNTGSVTIEVSDNMILSVTDTGIGITPEDLPRIFEKGFTGYNGRADKKSTGLGLYLVKKTADMLCNKISVKSEVGKGTTFAIDLRRNDMAIE